MKILRFKDNPLITPKSINPLRDDFEVIGVFNAGVTKFNGEILLLLRVAEQPIQKPDYIRFPVLKHNNCSPEIKAVSVKRDSPELDLSKMPKDGVIIYKGETFLPSISYLRLARSKDGRHFEVDRGPTILPTEEYEECGIEDPRITYIDGKYLIAYTANSRTGTKAALISTTDFKDFKRHGIIFCPENKDIAIFPEKVGGRYVALHRPIPSMLGNLSIWIAYSDDLIHWGEHKYVMGPRKGMWDELKIGPCAVPFKTEKGWLEIYHGVDRHKRYCLGAALFDLGNPVKLIARADQPFLMPETDYELQGFVNNVIFSCGVIYEDDGTVRIYYGAADTVMAYAEASAGEILASLNSQSLKGDFR